MRRAPNSKDDRETNVEERKIGLRTKLNGEKKWEHSYRLMFSGKSYCSSFFFFFEFRR